jgi:hypothetical protein
MKTHTGIYIGWNTLDWDADRDWEWHTAARDSPPRFVTIRRGGTLTDSDHQLLALWAASCAEHIPAEGLRRQYKSTT